MARVVLADVARHGEAVSAAALRLHDALRQHADHWDESTLIRDLNDTFLNTTGRAEYATAFLASYYSVSGELLLPTPATCRRCGTRYRPRAAPAHRFRRRSAGH